MSESCYVEYLIFSMRPIMSSFFPLKIKFIGVSVVNFFMEWLARSELSIQWWYTGGQINLLCVGRSELVSIVLNFMLTRSIFSSQWWEIVYYVILWLFMIPTILLPSFWGLAFVLWFLFFIFCFNAYTNIDMHLKWYDRVMIWSIVQMTIDNLYDYKFEIVFRSYLMTPIMI